MISLHENLILRDLAINSAREACRYLEAINYDFVAVETKSSNSDLVTEIDRDLEALIISSLRSERRTRWRATARLPAARAAEARRP